MGGGYSLDKIKKLGAGKFKEGKYAQAIIFYNESLKRDRNNHLIYSNRCLCYIKLNQFGYAFDDAI